MLTFDKAPSDGRLSFVETGAGHVSYISTSETQYIVLTKSVYLMSKLSFS